MLLIVKDKPTRALCHECRHLYVPTEAEITSQRNQRPVFICQPCRKGIGARIHQPMRRATGSI